MNLIDQLGGVTKVARAIGVTHGAIGNWRRRGWPDGAKYKLLALAQRSGIAIDTLEMERLFSPSGSDADRAIGGGETGHAA